MLVLSITENISFHKFIFCLEKLLFLSKNGMYSLKKKYRAETK